MILGFQTRNVNQCWTRFVGSITCVAVAVISIACAFDDYQFEEPESTIVPRFNPRPKNVSYPVGSDAILECSVSNLEARYVTWRKTEDPNPISIGDFIYSPDKRFSIVVLKGNDEWNLKIKNITMQDAGVYKCEVSSRIKNLFRLVLLRVTRKNNNGKALQEAPDTTVNSKLVLTGTAFVSKGEPIVLTCNSTSSSIAPDAFDWFKNGNKVVLTNNDNIKIEHSQHKRTLISTLTIRRSTMDDAAMFICRNSNLDVAQFQVHVLDEVPKRTEKRGTLKDGVAGIYSNLQCLTLILFSNLTCLLVNFRIMYPT